jgi:glycosyltransferase 2 family protein
MPGWLKTGLQSLIGLALGGGLLYLVFKDQDFTDFGARLNALNWGWLALGAFVMILAHVVRALRWQQLLEAAGTKVPVGTLFASVMAGYLANYGLPRLGEIVRCTLLYRNRRVAITQSAGTVVTERAADVLTLLLLLFALFVLEAPLLGRLIAQSALGSKTQLLWLLLPIALVGLLGIWLVLKYRERLVKVPILGKLIAFGLSLLQSIGSVVKLRNPGLFLVYTSLIWAAYWLSGLLILQASPATAPQATLYFTFILLLLGAVGTALPTPGGVGSFHAAIVLGYVALGFPESTGAWAALLMHTWQLVANAVVGFVCLLWMLRQPGKVASAIPEA